MSRKGFDSHNPVQVASVVLFDASRTHALLGNRLETTNEKRHQDTASTLTRTIAPAHFAGLSGVQGMPSPKPGTYPLSDQRLFRVGQGEHGDNNDTAAVEWVLAKAGLSEYFADGTWRGTGVAVLRTLIDVPDKDTQQSQWTDMIHYGVVLDEGVDLNLLPQKSRLYDPLGFVEAKGIPDAYDKKDAYLLGGAFSEGFICLTGACMLGAAHIIEHDQLSQFAGDPRQI